MDPVEPKGEAAGDPDAGAPVDPRGSTGPEEVTAARPPGGFTPEVAAALKTYVYLLVDPRTGRPFFAGRGKNDRCFRHLAAARNGGGPAGATPPDDDVSFPMLDKIRAIEAQGRSVRVDIVRHGLSSSEAKLVEAAVGDALGLPPGPGGGQRASATTLNVLLAPRAKFKRSHPVVLLRVPDDRLGQTEEQLRHGWRIGHRWTDPMSARSPRWAVLVAEGLVRAVVGLDGWAPEGGAVGGVATGKADRYGFAGERDAELERRYLGRNVEAYLGSGSPSSVTYVWCGPHWVNTPR